jgi:hypothetical protein
MALLNHPQIVSIYNVGENEGAYFLVLETQTWLGNRER